MSDLPVVQSRQVLPAEAMLTGSPATQEKDAQGIQEYPAAVEWTYPDGGLRAWLVVLGCFTMASTCMYADGLPVLECPGI
jgi:hypothetical protein